MSVGGPLRYFFDVPPTRQTSVSRWIIITDVLTGADHYRSTISHDAETHANV